MKTDLLEIADRVHLARRLAIGLECAIAGSDIPSPKKSGLMEIAATVERLNSFGDESGRFP